jgi:hypothetical protein
MRSITGATTGSSSFSRDGTDVDVPASRAFSTTKASQTPRDNGAEYDDDEDPLLDVGAKTAALGERGSDEHDTLRTQCLWINIFFAILVVARLKG